MQCPVHNKPIIGTCQWCGKPLCRLDVTKTMGKKLFCKGCSTELSDHIQTKQLEEIRMQNESETRQKKFNTLFENE